MKRLIAVVVLGFTVGCSTQDIKTTGDSPAPSAAGVTAVPSKAPQNKVATVGTPITLKGNDAGTQMRVTVLKIVYPASAGEYITPEAGNAFAGIQIRLENIGTTAYDDSPQNGAKLIDTADQEMSMSLADTNAGPSFGGDVKIAPGDARVGFLTFEVKKGTALKTFQFTLDSGFGPDTGQWRLAG